MVEGIIVDAVDNGQRLDRWLKKKFPDATFGEVQKILRTGQLRVDGKRVKGDARLAEGQVIRIPPQLTSPVKREERGLSKKDIAFIRALVIYQDDDIIAINKPAGLAVQGGSKITKHVDGLLDGLAVDGVKPHLVHRLDRDTSGVLLLARHPQMAKSMGELFRGRDIRKYYWAVTTPAPQMAQGKIKSAIGKVAAAGGERMMRVREEDGKMAVTYYSVLEDLGGSVALVAFWPRTGRTHQIRVHAAEMGAPLLGDYKYDYTQDFLDDKPELLQTLHLHARRVIFAHPATGKTVDITAELSPDMKKTFKFFGFDAHDKSDPFEDVE